MEYVQGRVTTLHDFGNSTAGGRGNSTPDAPTDRAAVVVPMTGRECASLAAERVFGALEDVAPVKVIVALRADRDAVAAVDSWLSGFDLDATTLWCDGPNLTALLDDAGVDGERGKGRDVWLALGVAADAADVEFVAVHDADARTYSPAHVPRLLFPLDRGFSFSKGYYARVENGRLYGRLFRLLYAPLVRTLADAHGATDAPVLDYLGAFRYALAGEFAATTDLVRRFQVPRGWGLEVGTLGDAFDAAGFEGSAQVDLGTHEHDHRAVSGPAGLSTMADEVADALLRVVEEGGVNPAYATLPDRYRETAARFIRQYEADAAFNDLAYDRAGEVEQVRAYAEALRPPGADARLPAWEDARLDPADVREAVAADVGEAAR